jgi:hypothetical protein
MQVIELIEEIKKRENLRSNRQVGAFLGVSGAAVGRGDIGIKTIAEKCPWVDLNVWYKKRRSEDYILLEAEVKTLRAKCDEYEKRELKLVGQLELLQEQVAGQDGESLKLMKKCARLLDDLHKNRGSLPRASHSVPSHHK